MIYEGPNRSLVREVIDLALGDRLLGSRGRGKDRPDLLIINDARRAVDAAENVGPEGTFSVDHERAVAAFGWEPEGEDTECDWWNLLANETAACIWTERWWDFEREHPPVSRLGIEFHGMVQCHAAGLLPAEPAWPHRVASSDWAYIAHSAASNLSCCAQHRAVNGAVDNVWERLLGLYREGLWPCGWQGVYPTRGRFLAWRRPA